MEIKSETKKKNWQEPEIESQVISGGTVNTTTEESNGIIS
jgi:hypothetical protein